MMLMVVRMLDDSTYKYLPVPLLIQPSSSVLRLQSTTSAMLVQKLIAATVISTVAVQCAVIPVSQSEPQKEGH